MAQSMHSLLECPICLGPFEDPRMLTDCFHSLCHKCLGNHIEHTGNNGQFRCPVCRKSLQIPGGKADAFPTNFFINSCIAAVADTGTGAKSKTRRAAGGRQQTMQDNVCGNSDKGDDCTQPEQFCIKCCEYYCKSCSNAHRKTKALRSHVLVLIETLTDEMLRDATIKSEAPRCQKHGKKLKLFCSNCQEAVCSVCCHISHQSHTFKEIVDVDADFRSELAKVMTTLQTKMENIKEQTAQNNQFLQKLERSYSSAKTSTSNIVQQAHQMLDQKAKQIEKELSQTNKDSRAEVDVQNKSLALHVQLLESLHTFTDDLLKRGTIYDHIRQASLPQLRSRLKELQEPSKGTCITIPNSANKLVIEYFSDLALAQEVKLSGCGFESAPSLEIQVKTFVKQDKLKVPTHEPGELGIFTNQVKSWRNIDGATLMVVKGDLTRYPTDAIVNAACTSMWHCAGSGLATAIYRKGGSSIMGECLEHVKRHGDVPPGNVIVSGPGALPCKVILHAVGPTWEGGRSGESRILRNAVLQALEAARKRQLHSIAIPAISTGTYGYPLRAACRVIAETVRDYYREGNRLPAVVHLVDYEEEGVDAFHQALLDLSDEKKMTTFYSAVMKKIMKNIF